MKKIFILGLLMSVLSVNAYPLYDAENYAQDYENNYCAPMKTTFMDRLKNVFTGVPTGYTPQIQPSPYLNSFGPSYMQGFYGSSGWNDHNIYNPIYSSAGLNILNN
ncbi:hypothetical protein J6G99_03090 [bacterium]|nr:hypothetical protein [bacterium]